MVNEGCPLCSRLMKKATSAVKAHVEIRALVADAVMRGDDAEAERLIPLVNRRRDNRERALEEYQGHLLQHRADRRAIHAEIDEDEKA